MTITAISDRDKFLMDLSCILWFELDAGVTFRFSEEKIGDHRRLFLFGAKDDSFNPSMATTKQRLSNYFAGGPSNHIDHSDQIQDQSVRD